MQGTSLFVAPADLLQATADASMEVSLSINLMVLMAIGGLVGWIARQESKAFREKLRSRKSSWQKGRP